MSRNWRFLIKLVPDSVLVNKIDNTFSDQFKDSTSQVIAQWIWIWTKLFNFLFRVSLLAYALFLNDNQFSAEKLVWNRVLFIIPKHVINVMYEKPSHLSSASFSSASFSSPFHYFNHHHLHQLFKNMLFL